MLRMPDRWVYTIEKNGEVPTNNNPKHNLYNWDWSEAYDSVETIGKMYTRGEAVDMIFNKGYSFVKYLATQYYVWESGVVTFMKKSVSDRQVMTLEEIWDTFPDRPHAVCEECYGSCSQCVFRKVDTEMDENNHLVVKDIHCMYDIKDEMLQSMAKGDHYCKHFYCLHMISQKNKTKC